MLLSPVKPAKQTIGISASSSPASPRSPPSSPPSIAPPTADVTPVITGDGRIYHPCHGHSFRAVSIFDLFPGIVKYQSKRFTERDRVDFLLSHSDRPFLVAVDEAAMWLTALKYLLNDAVLRPFDRLSPELTFVLRSYMSSHRKRTTLLTSIRTHGFLHVLSSLHQKVPASTQDIRRKMRQAERMRVKREARAREEARRAYESAQRMAAQRARQHSAQMAAAAHYHRMHYHGSHGYNVGYNVNVNVLPFGGAAASASATNQFTSQFAGAYGQEQLHSEMQRQRAPEEAQLDADAWQMVTEMVEQSKVEEVKEKEDEKEKGMEMDVVDEDEDEDDEGEEEGLEESEASDVYQVIFEAMTIQEGVGAGAGTQREWQGDE